MKMTRSKCGLVLQGYFGIERFRGSVSRRPVAQPKGMPRASPRPPRPEFLPAKMRKGTAQTKTGPSGPVGPWPDLATTKTRGRVGQPRNAAGPGGGWSRAPRPELLPGMGPSRLGGPRPVAQAKSGNGVTTTPVPAGQLRVIGEGRPLEPRIRETMENFFGADFSGVRVHEGPAAQAMGALAFTLGEELHFAPGLYDPGSREGVELLGHELAHVVQQRDGRVANPYGQGVAIVQDQALEAEADRLGQEVAERMWSRGPGC